MKRPTVIALIAFALTSFVWAADPPELVNYQGVLRNSMDAPLEGNFAMAFRFFNAAAGGDEILVDTHGSVTVSGGLFNVQLGGGSVTDGSGPGTFSSLGDVFRRLGEVYLEVEVSGETLSPRTRVVSGAYSMGDAPADPPCHGTLGNNDRFVDCGNGAVTDTVTGLIWLKDANCLFGPYSWWDANAWAAALADGECSLTDKSSPGDWRLPTKAEWEGVMNQAESNGCSAPYFPDQEGTGCCGTDTCAFTGVVSGGYWSRSTKAADPSFAWFADLSSPGIFESDKASNDRLLWAVRGAHSEVAGSVLTPP